MAWRTGRLSALCEQLDSCTALSRMGKSFRYEENGCFMKRPAGTCGLRGDEQERRDDGFPFGMDRGAALPLGDADGAGRAAGGLPQGPDPVLAGRRRDPCPRG